MCTQEQFSLNQVMGLGLLGPSAPTWKQSAVVTQTRGMIEPQPQDILCGKSKRCVGWNGSRRFRIVIESYKETYAQALTKWDKTSVTRTIFDSLSGAGSRFLKHNEALKIWEEISPQMARDKIGHALRFANRVSRRKGRPNGIGGEAALSSTRSFCAENVQSYPLLVLGTGSTSPGSHSQPPRLQLTQLSCGVPAGANTAKSPQLSLSRTRDGNTPQIVLEQPQAIFATQSFLPLDRPDEWHHQSTEADRRSKPVTKATTADTVASCLDESFSLLDSVFPLKQAAVVEPPKGDRSLDLDFFDKEILSVLF